MSKIFEWNPHHGAPRRLYAKKIIFRPDVHLSDLEHTPKMFFPKNTFALISAPLCKGE
jgi:hypothetical protein